MSESVRAGYHPPGDLYPFESRWLDLDGIRLHYLDEGPRDAPAVVMVHGNPTWSFYYRDLVIALRDRFRCIVPDHVGMGLSDKPGDADYPYTLERRIADFSRLVDALELPGPIALVVHDWGGMIGLGWAVDQPEQVSRLVVMNTAAFPIPAHKRIPWPLKLVRSTTMGAFLVRRFNAFARGATYLAVKKPMPPEVRAAYVGPYDTPANRIATLRFVQDIPLAPGDPGHDIVVRTGERLERFGDTPVLLAWGMQDFVFDADYLAEFERRWPHADVIRYPEFGHYVLEDGGRALVDTIGRFLDPHGSTGGTERAD